MAYITKVWYDCPACKEHVPEDEVFADCRQAVGQYGGIVIADIYCKCGYKLVSQEIVDNSGNIPPAKRNF